MFFRGSWFSFGRLKQVTNDRNIINYVRTGSDKQCCFRIMMYLFDCSLVRLGKE